jgi:hypothetical protein
MPFKYGRTVSDDLDLGARWRQHCFQQNLVGRNILGNQNSAPGERWYIALAGAGRRLIIDGRATRFALKRV